MIKATLISSIFSSRLNKNAKSELLGIPASSVKCLVNTIVKHRDHGFSKMIPVFYPQQSIIGLHIRHNLDTHSDSGPVLIKSERTKLTKSTKVSGISYQSMLNISSKASSVPLQGFLS